MSSEPTVRQRTFLFLQGPHGPFFSHLARQLGRAGHLVWRVGFNAGDQAFWRQKSTYLPYRGALSDWPEALHEIIRQHHITDIVLYGDARPVHAQAIRIGKALGLRIHVFEEGYMRPYWITYERDGSNGNSALMDLSLDQMRSLQETQRYDRPMPPGHWGDMHQHVFYGALYHWFVLFWNRRYPQFTPHRKLNVRQEFTIHINRLLLMPYHAMQRGLATRRIQRGSFPYHLAVLQLEHDSSFQMHSSYETQSDFVRDVIAGFAEGAPRHHHLVFKAHPLEDGRAPLLRDIRQNAAHFDIADRVHFVRGGKLARLLKDVVSAVTVNSTAGQQVLWRGIPLRPFGSAIYGKPELVSEQSMTDFFADPDRMDKKDYIDFRDFLLSTSQLPGSFYASKGRRQVLRRVTDMMLDEHGPYALTSRTSEADRQQLRLVT